MTSIIYQLVFLVLLFCGAKYNTKGYISVLSRNNTDTIRYACCIMVLFSHIMYPRTYFLLGYPHFVCVSIFFLLSGYGLTSSYINNRKKFVKKQLARIIKLIYPLVFVVLIEKMFNVPLGKVGLWWFCVLILFYTFFGIIAFITPNKYILLISNLVFFFAYTIFFQVIVSNSGINLRWTSYLGWDQQSIGFVIGIMISLWEKEILSFIKKNQVIISILAFCTLIIAGYIYIQPHDISKITYKQYFIRDIIFIACTILLFETLIHITIGNKIVIFIGSKLSIYIFALQGLFIGIAEIFFDKANYDIIVSFVTICSIVGAFIMYKLTEVILRIKCEITKNR